MGNNSEFISGLQSEIERARRGPTTEQDANSIAVTGYDPGWVAMRIRDMEEMLKDAKANPHMDVIIYLKKRGQTFDTKKFITKLEE